MNPSDAAVLGNLIVLLSAGAGHAVDDGIFVFNVAQCERNGDEWEDEDQRKPEHDVEDDWVVWRCESG